MALERWRPRWSPARTSFADPLRVRDFDDLFMRMFRDFGWGEEGWSPAVDVVDDKDEILVRADLPGVDPKHVNVSLENGTLTIRGERKEESERRDADYYCCERWSGSFVRSLPLPAHVDADKVRATFKNGLLEVHVPKAKEAIGKRIEVQAG